MKTNNQNAPEQKVTDVNFRNQLTRLVLLTSLIFSSLFALPHTSPANTPAGIEAKKIIEEYFKFPQMLTTSNEKAAASRTVEVLFTTDSTGNVNFVLAKTQNENLKHDVESQFYKLRLPKLKEDVVHSVVLNFKSL